MTEPSRDDPVAVLYAALTAAPPVELLTPLVAADGGRVVEATREDVAYRPRRDATVRLAATVERDGVEVREGWVVSAGGPPPAGAQVLEGPVGRVAAWRVRDDPDLPGLRSALDRAAVTGLLEALGLAADGLRLELVAVRPRRRAVVEVRTASARLFLKCLPPSAVADLDARHRACRDAGVPVPKALARDGALGLLVLSPLAGAPLRPTLLTDAPDLPPAADVAGLLDAFATVDLPLPARDPRRHARGHAALLASVLPAERARVEELVGRVGEGADDPRGGVHGDFYDAQLLVEGPRVTGVVDVDGAGTGRPSDDAGTLLAHLLVLRGLVPSPAAVHRWVPDVVAEVTARHEPAALARGTAAVLLGLATWPHTRHEPGWERQTRGLLDVAEAVLRDGVTA